MVISELLKTNRVWWKGLSQFIIIFSLLFVFTYSSYAQDNISRKGFTLGTSLGYGSTKYEYKDIHASEDSFAVGLQVGYAITPNIIAGLEVNGWTINAFNDSVYNYYYYYDYNEPSEGESISNASLFLNVFPFKEHPFYITGSVGKSYYDNYDRGVDIRETGTAFSVGCGYEFPISKTVTYAPQFRYSKGNFHHGDYKAAELSIALHWYIN